MTRQMPQRRLVSRQAIESHTAHGKRREGRGHVEAFQLRQVTETFCRLAALAADDQETAHQLRDALAESGLLAVFGDGPALDVVDLLDAGGEDGLRARLKELSLADLRGVIAARKYDPDKETARWRSIAKISDFIVAHAQAELARMDQPQALAAASWLL
jgi:hypothetical protein